MTEATQLGAFPTTIYIDPKDVVVDETYQRILDPKRVIRIAAHFDEKLFGIPLISRRNGKLYAVDGQHRIAAAIRVGLNRIPVQLVDDLGTTGEAWVWGQINNTRKLHTSVESFQGALVAGSVPHGEINEVLGQLALKLTKAKGEENIAAAGQLLTVFRRGGTPLVRDTLTLIKTVWYRYPLAFDKRFIGGVSAFLHIYEHIVEWDDLVLAMNAALEDGFKPQLILDKAKEQNPGASTGDQTANAAQVIKQMYNKYGHHKFSNTKRRPVNVKEYVGFTV